MADIGKSVWIGTGEGNLIIYDIFEQASLKTPTTDQSPSTETISSFASGNPFVLAPPTPVPPPRRKSGKRPTTPTSKAMFTIGMENVKNLLSDGEGGNEKTLPKIPSENEITDPENKETSSLTTSSLTLTASDATSTGTLTPNILSPKSSDAADVLTKKNCNGETTPTDQKCLTGNIDDVTTCNGDLMSTPTKESNTKHRKLQRLSDKNMANLSPVSSKIDNLSAIPNILISGEQGGGISPINGSSTPIARSGSPLSFDSSCETAENISKIVNVTDLEKSFSHSDLERKDSPDSQGRTRKVGRVAPMVPQNKAPHVLKKEDLENNRTKPKCTCAKEQTELTDKICDMCDDKFHKTFSSNGGLKYKNYRKKDSMDSIYSAEQADHNLLSNALAKLNFEDLEKPVHLDKVMSRNHKVNSWLSSLEDHTDDEEKEIMANGVLEKENTSDPDNEMSVKHSNDHDLEKKCQENGSTEQMYNKEKGDENLKCSENQCKIDNVNEKSDNDKKDKSFSTESTGSTEEVFCDAKESHSPRDSNSEAAFGGMTSSEAVPVVSNSSSPKASERALSDKSENSDNPSSTGKSSVGDPNKVSKSNDPELKYRLDFSGMYVESESDSSVASRQISLDLSKLPSVQSGRLENSAAHVNGPLRSKSSTDTPKLLDKMHTHTLQSRKLSLSQLSRDYLEWNDTSASPQSSMDQRVADFLRTPSISSRPSSLWSSYDNISTPSCHDEATEGQMSASEKKAIYRRNSYISHSTSSTSICSLAELYYSNDLMLQVKVKIADKPVRNFIKSRLVLVYCKVLYFYRVKFSQILNLDLFTWSLIRCTVS